MGWEVEVDTHAQAGRTSGRKDGIQYPLRSHWGDNQRNRSIHDDVVKKRNQSANLRLQCTDYGARLAVNNNVSARSDGSVSREVPRRPAVSPPVLAQPAVFIEEDVLENVQEDTMREPSR